MDWYPPNPRLLKGKPVKTDICVLARLLETTKPQNGFYTPDSVRTATNVKNNNNIVTRNAALVNLGRACATCKAAGLSSTDVHRMYISSAEKADQVFTLEMLSQNDTHPYISGEISSYMYVSLALGELYDRWQQAGGKGHYMALDPETKTVTYDPASPLRLEGINLHPGEHFPVDVSFILRNGVEVPLPINDFRLAIRQLITERGKTHMYGAFVYDVNIAASQNSQQRSSQNVVTQLSDRRYNITPNPTSGNITIRSNSKFSTQLDLTISDITGAVLLRKNNIQMQTGGQYLIDITGFIPGTYLLNISDSEGYSEVQKITKR